MPKIIKLFGRKPQELRTPEAIQQEYNETCAKLGQDVVRVEDLARASKTLSESVEEYKKKIFGLLTEMIPAREKASQDAAKALAEQKTPEGGDNA